MTEAARPVESVTLVFKCGHTLTVELSRSIKVGSSVRCSACLKSTVVKLQRFDHGVDA